MNSTGATSSTRCQFTRREFVNFTGLQFSRARWYDPNLGRFISEDPIGFDGQDINLYGYTWNNPTLNRDPLGLFGSFDFVAHYFTGGGAAVDLAAVGLLSNFRNSSSVIAATTGFKYKVIQRAKAEAIKECDKNCVIDKKKRSTYFSLSDRTGTDVTNEPGLFAVGRSTFFRNAVCFVDVDCRSRDLRFRCTLGFSIRDRFTDPLDGDKVGFPFNLPGAQPYNINASWTEEFSGGCKF